MEPVQKRKTGEPSAGIGDLLAGLGDLAAVTESPWPLLLALVLLPWLAWEGYRQRRAGRRAGPSSLS